MAGGYYTTGSLKKGLNITAAKARGAWRNDGFMCASKRRVETPLRTQGWISGAPARPHKQPMRCMFDRARRSENALAQEQSILSDR
jgi:hypothetical protein